MWLKKGRAALEAINKSMGLAFDEFDLEVPYHSAGVYATNFFKS